MEQDIIFFKDLKNEATIIKRSSELGGNADLISVMNMIMLKRFYEKLTEKNEITIDEKLTVKEIDEKKDIKTSTPKK